MIHLLSKNNGLEFIFFIYFFIILYFPTYLKILILKNENP